MSLKASFGCCLPILLEFFVVMTARNLYQGAAVNCDYFSLFMRLKFKGSDPRICYRAILRIRHAQGYSSFATGIYDAAQPLVASVCAVVVTPFAIPIQDV